MTQLASIAVGVLGIAAVLTAIWLLVAGGHRTAAASCLVGGLIAIFLGAGTSWLASTKATEYPVLVVRGERITLKWAPKAEFTAYMRRTSLQDFKVSNTDNAEQELEMFQILKLRKDFSSSGIGIGAEDPGHVDCTPEGSLTFSCTTVLVVNPQTEGMVSDGDHWGTVTVRVKLRQDGSVVNAEEIAGAEMGPVSCGTMPSPYGGQLELGGENLDCDTVRDYARSYVWDKTVPPGWDETTDCAVSTLSCTHESQTFYARPPSD